MKKKFQSKSREYEIMLLQKGDPEFKDMVEYLKPLIEDVLARFSMPQEIYDKLYEGMVKDIPIAAERFLGGGSLEAGYKFSTYFSWYISEWINNTNDELIKRKRRLKQFFSRLWQ